MDTSLTAIVPTGQAHVVHETWMGTDVIQAMSGCQLSSLCILRFLCKHAWYKAVSSPKDPFLMLPFLQI